MNQRSAPPGERRPAATSRHRFAARSVLLVVLVALAPFSAWSTVDARVGSDGPHIGGRPTRVLAVGDSVMEGAAAAIPAALPGREVVVDTKVSRSTAASADAAATHGTDWDVVFVLLGHNDGGSPGVYQPAYRRLLDMFANVPRIYVMTVHEARPYYRGVNDFLRAEAANRPNVRVLDWNAVDEAHPGTTGHDGLHLTPAGARLMAAEIAAHVIGAEWELAPVTATTTSATTTTRSAADRTRPASIDRPGAEDGRVRTGVVKTSAPSSPASVDTDVAVPSRIPHTPEWGWPAVICGAVLFALVLRREHHLRSQSRTEG